MKAIIITMKSAACGRIDVVFKISNKLHSEIVNLKKEFIKEMHADGYNAKRVREVSARLNETLESISFERLGAKRLNIERFILDV